VAHELVRLRVLNASNARVYDLGFDDDRPFQLVGTDGGLLARPHTTSQVLLSPGERAEVVVRLQPGERTVLRSTPPDLGLNPFSDRFAGGDDRFDLLELRAADELAPAGPLPERLADPELPDPAEATTTRRFELQGGSLIDGRTMDVARIDEVVAVGTTEIWEVANQSGRPHNFHVHDVQFRVVDLGGSPPPPELAGAKDTVFLPPGATARLALAFTDHTDPERPYMFHCHLLAHEDAGMMGQFTVVEPDDVDRAPRRIDAHGRHGSPGR
jgi:FtsP/CotA-like multicopper oxidase with cupredoxin domain